jgi:hypothetical protein
LCMMTPAEVIEQVTARGLAERGGAEFPPGLKWTVVSNAVNNTGSLKCPWDPRCVQSSSISAVASLRGGDSERCRQGVQKADASLSSF